MPSGGACLGADGAAAVTGRSSRRGAVAGRRADGGRRADDAAGHSGAGRRADDAARRRTGAERRRPTGAAEVAAMESAAGFASNCHCAMERSAGGDM